MSKIKNALSKMRKHISSEEFKSIESIGLLRLIPKILKSSVFLMCLLMIRWGILDTVKFLRASATETELAALNLTTNFLNSLLIVSFTFVLFVVLAKRMVQQQVYLIIKDVFYLGLIVLTTTLPKSINITSQQGDYLLFASLICLVLVFLMRRFIYIKEIQTLIKLGVIDETKSQFNFFRIKELNYFVNTPDQLTKVNHEWLPFVDIFLEGDSRTILNEDWNDKCTSQNYSIVVQSKFSGLKILHHISIHTVIERFVTMPKNANVLNESEEK